MCLRWVITAQYWSMLKSIRIHFKNDLFRQKHKFVFNTSVHPCQQACVQHYFGAQGSAVFALSWMAFTAELSRASCKSCCFSGWADAGDGGTCWVGSWHYDVSLLLLIPSFCAKAPKHYNGNCGARVKYGRVPAARKGAIVIPP